MADGREIVHETETTVAPKGTMTSAVKIVETIIEISLHKEGAHMTMSTCTITTDDGGGENLMMMKTATNIITSLETDANEPIGMN